MPDNYDSWKGRGKLPVLTGSTDTHTGTFADPERTVILAEAASGDGVAGAVRADRTVLLNAQSRDYLYGPDSLVHDIWAALADGEGLRTQKAGEIRSMLARADIALMIRMSPSTPGKLEGTD